MWPDSARFLSTGQTEQHGGRGRAGPAEDDLPPLAAAESAGVQREAFAHRWAQERAAAAARASVPAPTDETEKARKKRVQKQHTRHPDWLRVQRPGGDDTIRRPAAWTMHDDAWTGGGDARQQLCATGFSSNAALFGVAPAAALVPSCRLAPSCRRRLCGCQLH